MHPINYTSHKKVLHTVSVARPAFIVPHHGWPTPLTSSLALSQVERYMRLLRLSDLCICLIHMIGLVDGDRGNGNRQNKGNTILVLITELKRRKTALQNNREDMY